MKSYKYLLFALGALLMGCEELEMSRTYPEQEIVAPRLGEIPDISITANNMDQEMDFTWSKADFGVPTQVDYALEASLTTTPSLELITGLTTNSIVLSYELLNQVLFNGLEMESDKATPVYFFVSAKIGSREKIYSAPVPAQITTTKASKAYPMVYVIGSFNAWQDYPQTQQLFDFDGTDTNYSGLIGFGGKASEGFKIRGTQSGWSDESNWGLDSEADAPATEAKSIALISKGSSSNISIYSHDFYSFTFDKSGPALSVNFRFDCLGVIGSATPNGWDADTDLQFDPKSQRFWADIALTDGEIKFRADDSWDLNWGLRAGDNFLSSGGDNIAVSAGEYRLWLDLNNPKEIRYELSAEDYGKE